MNRAEFIEKIESHPHPVVVDFWAAWCMPCRAIEPAMDRLIKEYAGRVDVWKINADEHPGLLTSLGVFSIPTLVAYQGGREVRRCTGAAGMPTLAGLFESALTGVVPQPTSPVPIARLVRLGIGGTLFALALVHYLSGASSLSGTLLLGLAGLVVAFSAVYDRCPVYRAIKSKILRN